MAAANRDALRVGVQGLLLGAGLVWWVQTGDAMGLVGSFVAVVICNRLARDD